MKAFHTGLKVKIGISGKDVIVEGPAGLAVKPLDLHLVNVGSIPGPTHGQGRLQPHPGDVLKSTPNVRKSPRSGMNLEGRLSDPQFFLRLQRPFFRPSMIRHVVILG